MQGHSGIDYLLPWKFVDGEIADQMVRELFRELSNGHLLYGANLTALAKRIDCDDVLFELRSEGACLAVVHLTWRNENDPLWPRTKLFDSWDDWVRDDMEPNHKEWVYTPGSQ